MIELTSSQNFQVRYLILENEKGKYLKCLFEQIIDLCLLDHCSDCQGIPFEYNDAFLHTFFLQEQLHHIRTLSSDKNT